MKTGRVAADAQQGSVLYYYFGREHFGRERKEPKRPVRFYQPRREILDGSWTFPDVAPAKAK